MAHLIGWAAISWMCHNILNLLVYSSASLRGNLSTFSIYLVAYSSSGFVHRACFLMIFLAALAASRFGGLSSFSILTHVWHFEVPWILLSS